MDRFAPAAFVTELEPQKPVHFFLHTPLYNRIFECPENIRNDGFPDVCWPSKFSQR